MWTFFMLRLCLFGMLSNQWARIEARSVRMRSTNIDFSPKHFENISLALENNTITVDLVVIKPIVRGLKVFLDFQMDSRSAKKFQTLFQHTLDVCGALNTLKNSLFKRYFRTLLKQGNFLAECPVKPGYYYLRNWRMDSDLLPKYLYPGDYRVQSEVFYGELRKPTEDNVFRLTLDLSIV